jgi:hypothetical protein
MNYQVPEHISSPETIKRPTSRSPDKMKNNKEDTIPLAPSVSLLTSPLIDPSFGMRPVNDFNFSSLKSIRSFIPKRLKYEEEISKFDLNVALNNPPNTCTPKKTLATGLFVNSELSDGVQRDIFSQLSNHCNCKKTKCNKKYCICFKNSRECNDLCLCNGCDNLQQSSQKSKKLRENITCSCKKSKCSKKYCECYSSSKKCKKGCLCSNCGNQEEPLDSNAPREERIMDEDDYRLKKRKEIFKSIINKYSF